MNDRDLGEALRSTSADIVLAAFDRHYDAMSWLARAVVGDGELASDVVVDTWIDALGVARAGGAEPPYRAWLFDRLRAGSVVAARLRGATTGPADQGRSEIAEGEFFPRGHRWEDHWVEFPQSWNDRVSLLASPAGQELLAHAIDALPPSRRALLILRDLDGWSTAEAGVLLDLSAEVQRDELQRARLAVGAAIDDVLVQEPR